MKKLESIFKDNFEVWIDENLISRPHSVLVEIERKAKEFNIPILSPTSGAILKFLVEMFKPKQVLELGTGLGYSTCWMLLSNLELEIHTIDRNPECLNKARDSIDKIIHSKQKVEYIKTHGMLYLQNQASLENYDFIFIDFDKITYPDLLRIFLNKCQKDVKLLFDNVLWHGRLNPEIYNRPSDLAIQELWNLIKKLELKRTLFPSGDGLLLIQK